MAERTSRHVKTLSHFIKWAAQFNDRKYFRSYAHGQKIGYNNASC